MDDKKGVSALKQIIITLLENGPSRILVMVFLASPQLYKLLQWNQNRLFYVSFETQNWDVLKVLKFISICSGELAIVCNCNWFQKSDLNYKTRLIHVAIGLGHNFNIYFGAIWARELTRLYIVRGANISLYFHEDKRFFFISEAFLRRFCIEFK